MKNNIKLAPLALVLFSSVAQAQEDTPNDNTPTQNQNCAVLINIDQPSSDCAVLESTPYPTGRIINPNPFALIKREFNI